MSDSLELSVSQLQREKLVFDILRLLLWEKDEHGRAYSIEKACNEVGIDSSTWRRWVQEGIVSTPLQQLADEMSQTVQQHMLPYHQEIMGNLVRMARGLPPEGTDMVMRPKDVLAAIKMYREIIPTRSIDQEGAGQKTEMEHLDTYQPKQLPINVLVQGDFIYTGNKSARLGELEPIEPEDVIEGELP